MHFGKTLKAMKPHDSILQKAQTSRESYDKRRKMLQTVFQVAFDGKKLLGKKRFAVLAISKEGDYFIGMKTFRTEERCNAEACSQFIIRYVVILIAFSV